MATSKNQLVTYVSDSELERLDAYCASEQRSRSWALAQALEQMLDDYAGDKSEWNPNDVHEAEVAATGPKVNEPRCVCEHWETQHHLHSGKRGQCKKCACVLFRPEK